MNIYSIHVDTCVHADAHPAGRALSESMVPNPIYDGPMYESIHQQFNKVVHTPNSDCALLTPSPSPTSPHYVRDLKQYENMDLPSAPTSASSPAPESTLALNLASSVLSPSPITEASLIPPIFNSKTPKERNKLQLTLNLNNLEVHGSTCSSERASRRRANTIEYGDRLGTGSSFRGRCVTAPSIDDNYITLSPFGTVPGKESGKRLKEYFCVLILS